MSVDLTKKIMGTAYVARIKDPRNNLSIHKKPDFLHAIAYDDPQEPFDYMQLKSLVEGKNQLIFYSYTINKRDRTTFTWKQCLEALAANKPTGDVCIVLHDEPISFGRLAKLAYEHHVLHDSTGYNELLEILHPTLPAKFPKPSGPARARSAETSGSDLEAVRHGIRQAQELNQHDSTVDNTEVGDTFVGDTGVGSNLVVNDKLGEHQQMSMEYWRSRALAAEEKNSLLTKEKNVDAVTINNLRNELASCGDAKQRFSAQADLASARLNEHKVASAEPFIEAIKPQIACLPGIQNSLKELLDKVIALGDIPNVLKGVYDELMSLSQSVKEAGEDSEAKRESDTESIICIVERLSKVLAHFGISTSAPKIDLPKTVANLGAKKGPLSDGGTGVHGVYSCECGCGENVYGIDVSKPPPASAFVPSPSPCPAPVASSHPAPSFTPAVPQAPVLGSKTDEKTSAPHSTVPNLPYPLKDTFLENFHNSKSTFLLYPANKIAPQGYLMHHQQQHHGASNICNKDGPASTKRAHEAKDADHPSKKQC